MLKTHLVARQLGWVLLLMDVVVIVGAVALLIQAGAHVRSGSLLSTSVTEFAFIAFPTVGALTISRRPENTIGWIFCVIGLGTAWTSFSAGFVAYALATRTDTSAVVALVDVFGNAVWPMNLGLGVLLLFLFPTGHLFSPLWRFPFWCTLLGMFLDVVTSALVPGPLESNNRVQNPLGIAGASGILQVAGGIAQVIIIPCALAAVLSIVVRYIKSRDVQRQQIKWFAVGVVSMAVIIAASVILIPEQSDLSNITFAVAFAMIPIGAGIGILRYRLFDIDVIINRTLVYGSLTAVLAAIYFAGVLGAQQLTRVLTGQEKPQSPVVIVVTTLLIAALFQPLRRSIQRFIDKRFYRSRYDVKKTLDRFGSSLRSQVELDHLTVHLLETVEQTMHPAHVSLWLRARSPRSSETT